ncbi:MAG: beta-ketoacyl-ACP synthase [Legionellales bacterium]|nr:beta-ketoacyl-ACP synthase [Legionellales bacterium]
MSKRVVITGMAGVTSLGDDEEAIFKQILAKKTGIKVIEDWKSIDGLNTKLGAPIENFKLPDHYTRKKVRSMGRVAQLATVATERALIEAGLWNNTELLGSGRLGIAYGSCSGSTYSLADLVTIRTERSVKNVTATTYVKAMSHTCAVNIAIFFGITGRIIPTSSACTSGSQAIGYAYEAIKHGYQDMMIAGGADELCPSQVAIFDTLYATSQKNDQPNTTPAPFDQDRDGLVLGEGASTLILESLDHALARNAKIYAETVGFGTNCDAIHITQPTTALMEEAMRLALSDAELTPDQIAYINAHGTATEKGDIAESRATFNIFGEDVPISSLKGHFGHTLGACGTLEAWLSITMMNQQCFLPTANLNQVDPLCAPLDYIKESVRTIDADFVMSNNFAFGGINTSLIFRRY